MRKQKEVLFYTDSHSKCHIKSWLEDLDLQTKARILNRISRLEYGAYGDYKLIDNKLFELRCFFGKGYRVYFTEENNKIIILLNAGDKDSQQKDIKKARELLKQYLNIR
jgi:putative addiction module killer protein